MKTKLYFLLLFICPFSISFSQLVQQTATLDNPSVTSWTVPCGVTEITVEVIGGGGGGGYSNVAGTAAAGGGGGAYAQRVIPVNAGDVFYCSIGSGGLGSQGANSGGDTWFNDVNSTPTVDSPYALLAKGGQGVANNSLTGATGGSADASIGAIRRNGGKGGDGKHQRSCFLGICSSNSGAGGGAGGGHFASNGGNGGNGGNSNNGGAGGTSVAPGGNGGNGVGTANHGYPGYIYGGAGGGGKQAALLGNDKNGGNGAGGVIKITYWAPSGTVQEIEAAASLTSSAGTELGCSPTPTTLSATGNSEGNGVSTLWFEADPETPTCPEVSFVQPFTTFPYSISGGNTVGTQSSWTNRIEFRSTTNTPSIDMSNVLVGKNINPATQRYISLRYYVRSGGSYQPAGKAQIWFMKSGDTAPIPSQMQEVDLISNGNWHILNIDMHSGPNGANWDGDITGWYFHFATNSGANVLFNYMILSDTPLLEHTSPILTNPGNNLQFTIPNDRASITIGTYRIARKLDLNSDCSTAIEKTGCRFITLSRTDKKFNIATSSGNWDEGANWSPSGVPTISNCVLIPSGKTVFINSNDAAAKLLTVQNTGKLEILPNQSLTVEGAISNNSGANNFIVHDNANLIQVDPSATNTGNIKVTKQVTDLSGAGPAWSYIYWSSPVAGQSLHSFSPGTPTAIGQWGFLEYNEATDYMPHTSDTHFIPGKGYAIRAEAGLGNTYSKPYHFTGVPNNGVITFPLKKLEQGFNLVGNPYPSNINADVLFAMNTDKIYGTVYLWTNNHPQQHQQGGGYYANTYAIYNGTGGNAATQPADGPGMTDTPNGTISVGQGFLVEAKNNDVDLVFSNINPLNGDLLRVSTAAPLFQKGGKDRFWLKLTSPSQVANTTLIGYIHGATDGIDKDFDGEFWGASDAIYSLIENDPYLIQGKSYPLNIEDIVPLGINIFEEGTYMIELENPEGIFTGEVKVYLRDKLTGREQNLNNQSYKFVIEPGNFEGRFEIFYKKIGFSTTSVLNTFATASQDIFVTKERQNIIILSTKNNILATEVFNIVGLPVYSADNINGKEFRFLAPVNNSQNNILFIKVKDEFGNVSHHKLIMK